MFYLIGWQNTWGHDCRHCMGTRSSGAGSHRTFFLLRRTTAHCQDPTCFSWVAERVVGSEQVGLLANSFVCRWWRPCMFWVTGNKTVKNHDILCFICSNLVSRWYFWDQEDIHWSVPDPVQPRIPTPWWILLGVQISRDILRHLHCK